MGAAQGPLASLASQSRAVAWGALLQAQKGPGVATWWVWRAGLALEVNAMPPAALGETGTGKTPPHVPLRISGHSNQLGCHHASSALPGAR